MVDEVLKIIEEAKKRNYPNFILIHDLQKLFREHDRTLASEYANDYTNGYESGYDEAKEECYDVAFDDGKQEGIGEARNKFVKFLAHKIIKLKQRLKETTLTDTELQQELTNILVSMDEDDNIPYLEIQDILDSLDGTQNE